MGLNPLQAQNASNGTNKVQKKFFIIQAFMLSLCKVQKTYPFILRLIVYVSKKYKNSDGSRPERT